MAHDESMPNPWLKLIAQLHVRDLFARLGIPWNGNVPDPTKKAGAA